MVKASYLLAAPVKSLYSPIGDLEKAGGSFPPHRSLWRDPKDLKHGLATRKLEDATQSAGPCTKLHRGYSLNIHACKTFSKYSGRTYAEPMAVAISEERVRMGLLWGNKGDFNINWKILFL